MDNYKVSVIVPVYNCEEYISDTLKSIINQDFDDYEIIVVDDGSTDGSREQILQTLNDCDVPNKVLSQENSGVSAARNSGINASSGDYLVFVDADDYITPNHLSELYNGESDFSLIQYVKKDGDNLSEPSKINKDILTSDEFIERELKMEFPFKFFQVMYKSDIIKDNSIFFDSNLVYGEDTDFAHRVINLGKNMAVSNEVTYYYVQREDSAVNTTEFRRFDIVKIFTDLAGMYKEAGKPKFAELIEKSRIPIAIFGNMNYFFYKSYDFDEVMKKMGELDLFTKLEKFEGSSKFKLKIKLFLSNPKLYYLIWKKFKNSIG